MKNKASLVSLTIPIFIEYLLAMLVGNIDQIMISNYSEDSVTAIGNANQVLNLLVLTFTIISLATTVLVTQYIGAGRTEKISVTYTLAVAVNAVISVAISIFLVVCANQIFDFMAPPEEQRENFVAYISIVGGGIFLQAMFTTFSAILKSNAFARQVMYLSVVMNIVNIVLNYCLIYGHFGLPELGVRGVAIATVIGRLIVVILVVIVYYRLIGKSLRFSQLKPFPGDTMLRMVRIGVPSAGESISYNITLIIIMQMINSFGMCDIKTKLFASVFAMITWMFASSISQASQILTGYLIGEGRNDDANRSVMKTLRLSMLVTTAIAALLYMIEPTLFSLVTKSPEVIALGKTIMFIDIFLELGRSVNIVMVRSLQAAGDVNFPIGLGICSTWLLAVGLSYILGVRLGMGLKGVWLAMMCDELSRATIFVFRWRSGVWRTKKVI